MRQPTTREIKDLQALVGHMMARILTHHPEIQGATQAILVHAIKDHGATRPEAIGFWTHIFANALRDQADRLEKNQADMKQLETKIDHDVMEHISCILNRLTLDDTKES